MKGTYITSTLATAQTDERKNVGFVVKYRPGKEDIARVNTRTVNNIVDNLEVAEEANRKAAASLLSRHDISSHLKILAFKALPALSAFATEDSKARSVSEEDFISSVCDEIKRAALPGKDEGADLIENEDIISLSEARKNTGLVEQWGHSLKRMVWG